MHLKPNEVYDFQIAAVLGGKIDLRQCHSHRFVSLSIGGQLHDQVRKHPPSTGISGVEVINGRLHVIQAPQR